MRWVIWAPSVLSLPSVGTSVSFDLIPGSAVPALLNMLSCYLWLSRQRDVEQIRRALFTP